MIFRAFYTSTGCASYLFGCGTLAKCAVVDPQADLVDRYLEEAQRAGMKITHVFDTHVHADHRSGGRALADRAGARYCLHRSAELDFAFDPVDDGQEIELGNTRVKVLHTPGHTPESISLLVTDLRRGPEPWFVCTGDALFVGAVGRPDLPGHERDNAALLHRALHEKLLTLPKDLEVYPAHIGGSACGAGISGKPSSTLGFELKWNPLLSLPREAFVEKVVESIPARPEGMDAMLRFNQGRA